MIISQTHFLSLHVKKIRILLNHRHLRKIKIFNILFLILLTGSSEYDNRLKLEYFQSQGIEILGKNGNI